MKVLVAIVLVIGSVSARGSGPYLPSGWKPQGPAFFLPSEVAKSEDNPLKETLFQETEASGSEALREYGPPKLEEVSLSVKQDLPEVATEQTFFVEVKNEETVAAVEETVNVEANKEQSAAIVEETSTATESQVADVVQAVEEQATEQLNVQPTVEAQELDEIEKADKNSKVFNSDEVKEEVVAAVEEIVVPAAVIVEEIIVPTATVEEVVVPLAQQELVQDAVPADVAKEFVLLTEQELKVVTEELVEDAVPTSGSGVAIDGVNNIAEAIVDLENEVKTEVLTTANIAEINTAEKTSGAPEQVSGGFLEYSPPGFAVYGPPKDEDLARLTAAEGKSENALENNEVRRRRFSPKIRSTKKH